MIDLKVNPFDPSVDESQFRFLGNDRNFAGAPAVGINWSGNTPFGLPAFGFVVERKDAVNVRRGDTYT